MKENTTQVKGASDYVYYLQRLLSAVGVIALFFPSMNPTRVCALVSENISLFTSAVSYNTLISGVGRGFRSGWVQESSFYVLYIAAIIAVIGIALTAAGACCSLGNLKLKRLGLLFSVIGGIVQIGGFVLTIVGYNIISNGAGRFADKVLAEFPTTAVVYRVIAGVIILLSLVLMGMLPKAEPDMKYEMESKFKLFLMFLPFAALAAIFCYLPLYGWRYAFFDYQSGGTLSMDNFVGFKWFAYLFQNATTRSDVLQVMANTLGISALNILTQWIPMVFAIFLCEIKSLKFRRFVQTFTTVPNFISWVLVYAIALAIFSTDGFVNTFAKSIGLLAEDAEGKNYLMGDSFTWVKMWAWGTWKGVGWSAIIYIAGIAGIDQQLYEAAEIDGAGRFQKMWHITVPGLLPTFFVLLLMAIAGILSNGLDQYLVFHNAQNHQHIQVLDLYVYYLGLGSNGSIPLSTVVGMFKSVISVILLFGANAISKALRGESII